MMAMLRISMMRFWRPVVTMHFGAWNGHALIENARESRKSCAPLALSFPRKREPGRVEGRARFEFCHPSRNATICAFPSPSNLTVFARFRGMTILVIGSLGWKEIVIKSRKPEAEARLLPFP